MIVIQMGTYTVQAVTLCLLITTILADTFTVSLSSALTLASAVSYTLNATFTSKAITAGAYALVTTSANFNLNTSALTNPTFATTLASSYSATTYTLVTNSSGNFITFASLYPAALAAETLLSLKMNMPNPWGVGTEPISLTILDSSGNTLVAKQTFAPTYTASPLNNCQWTSSSSINGDSSTRTISFVPSAPLMTTAFIQVSMPVWFSSTVTSLVGTISCSAISNIDFAPTCNNTVVGGTTEVYATTGTIFASNKTVSSAVSLTMGNFKNPWSLKPFSPIIIELYGSATRVTQSCTTLSQTNTALNTFTLFSTTGTYTTISAVSSSKFVTFTTRNPLPNSGGQLRITMTNGATVAYTVQGGIVLVSTSSTQVVISNISATDLGPGASRPLAGWTFTNPPSTRTFTITLTSVVVTGGVTYGIDSSTLSYSCNAGNIITYSFSTISNAINAVTTYSITFTTIYALTTNSYIGILFPNYISVGSGCSSTNGLLSCAVSNTSYGNISISGAVPAATSLNIKFTAVTNPSQAFTSSPFQIYTYYDSGLDSLVDKLTSGMTFTGIANQIPPANVYITPSSFYTYATANYIFTITLVDKILAGGTIGITFPSVFTFGAVALASASFPTTSCVLGVSGKNVNLTGCFSADYAPLTIIITLSGIINPPSLEPTSSFAIKTYGPLGLINTIISGLTVTMTSASTSTAFTITPQVLTVHASTSYSFTLTFLTPHSANDYLLLTIPASMQISATPSCAANSGIGLVTCSAYTSTTAKMVMSLTPSASIVFTFSSLRNYDISSTTISFQCYVYSSTGYLMEVTPVSSVTYTDDAITSFSVASNNQIVLNSASNITVTLSAPFDISATFNAALTSLTFTIPAQFSLLANSSCSSTVGTSCNKLNSTTFQVVAPGISLVSVSVQFSNILLPSLTGSSTSFAIQYLYNSVKIATVSAGVVVSAYCSSPCQQCTTSTITCSSCLPAPNLLILLYSPNSSCVSSCPSGYFTNGSVCSACVPPCLTCTTATACLTCNSSTIFYSLNSSCISGCPTGYYNSSTNCTLCVSPCLACTTLTLCSSCVTNFLYNSSCVNASACPVGTYGNTTTNVCESCQSPCVTCFGGMANCTSCNGSNALYNNTCLGTCPATFYANAFVCVPCVGLCLTCSSATFCLSCISSYLYNGTCYNASACPTGTFANLTALTCDGCLVNCSTCAVVASNCTSCASPYFNYNGTCVNVCPSGLFQNVTVCSTCVPPCATCTSASSCLSCATNFYTNHSCVVDTLCPMGTFANLTALNCDPCAVNCSGCALLPTNCTACASPYFNYNGTCVNVCPNGLFQNVTICSNCVLPCATCTTATLCLSCSVGYFTNHSCVNASLCPMGTFANLTSLNCDPCAPNCTTCALLPFNCTSCSSPYYNFNGTCVNVCPSGLFQNVTVCSNCVTPCATCTTQTLCLSCATNFYTNNSCVVDTLCPMGTFANATALNCDPCAINCSACALLPTNCTGCASPYFNYNGTCVNVCPNGLFQNVTVCSNCVSPCATCTTQTLCLSCSVGYFTNHSCVNASLCPAGTFANLTALNCDPCTSNCTTCALLSYNCTTCSSPYFNYNGTCINVCPSGLFQNVTVCSVCVSPCATCTTQTLCLSCSVGYFTNNSCVNVSSCPMGTFANLTSLNCDPCIANCTTCYSLPSNCTSCTAPLLNFNGSCVNVCPPGMFPSGTLCLSCPAPCLLCTTASICTSCSASYLSNSSCVNASQCPAGTFANLTAFTCDICMGNCSTCSMAASICTACTSPYFYLNGTCQTSCPGGMFQNGTICSNCTLPCATCTAATTCLSCATNYYTNFTCVPASSCPTGTFANLTALTCDGCLVNCSTCAMVASNCTSCASPYFNYNGTCVNVCPSGLFQNVTVCSACVPPCATCTSASSCLSCATNFYTNHSCVVDTLCPIGTFANVTALNCDLCAVNCSACAFLPTNCTACASPYFRYNGTCVNVCPSGLFQNVTVCSVCVSPCATCTTETLCLSCVTNFYTNHSCVVDTLCPMGTFANATALNCDTCAINCSSCSLLPTNCTGCASPYFNYNGTCVNVCPNGLFQNVTICSSCVTPCATCTTATLCLSCSVGYFTNHSCVSASSCPMGTFANLTSLNCDPCTSNCTTCALLPSNCTSCSSPYYNYNGTCVNACPSGLFQNVTVCSVCVSPCATCTTQALCLSCSVGYLTNRSCVNASLCPAGTFANLTTLNCDSCTANCTTCALLSYNCTSCSAPWVFYGQQCINLCPNSTYQSGTLCLTCVSPCNYCTTNTTCISCASNFYYSNQSCLTSSLCPNRTYADTANLNCSSCSSPCLTCSLTPSNCTACIPPKVYNNNYQCLSACPIQMYNSSSVCTACISPCGNCTSGTSCLSCVSGFFLTSNSCVNSSSCPNGTYAESTNNTCNTCSFPCTSCNTASVCFTCSISYYYYNFACIVICPNITFPNSTLCSPCSPSCLTCSVSYSNCTSCQPSLNFYNNTCMVGCPPGTYNASGSCASCSSACATCSNFTVCTGCTGALFLTNSQCLTSCPAGTFANSATNTCSGCTQNCATCEASASNCSTCSGNFLYYSFSCSLTCPTNFFNISGVCITCPNCNSCTSATSCFICATGYYLYQGGCYTSCPSVAPHADSTTFTCSLCGASCSSCSSDGSYCFTCSSGYFILDGKCYVTCPSGYTSASNSAKCTPVKAVSSVYYPFTISLACISLIFLFSKFKYAHTDFIGNITAFLAIGFLLSTAAMTIPTYISNTSTSQRLLQTDVSNTALMFLLGVGIAVISVLFLTGLCFIILIMVKFQKDPGVQLWRKNTKVNKFMFWLVSILSCFHFAIFRFIYSKLFLRQCFSCYFKAHKRLLFITNVFTFVVILLTNVPAIALSTFIIMKQEGNSQLQIFAIDNLVVSTTLGILLLLDMGNRNPEDFESILEDFPYLKKTKKYQDLDSSSGSLMSIHYSEEDPHYKTEADSETLGKLGRINAKQKLGNFGAIDQLQETLDNNNKVITKTLPEFSKLKGDANFDPYQLKRINDDLFFQEKEYTKKFNEIKQEYTKGMLDQEMMDDDGATHHNEDMFRESVNVEELINQRKKQVDPQEYLNRFKSEDYDDLNEEQMALLMEMAEQKGLDPKFIRETFGKNKYYNKKILQEIMGDHQQVSKESLQELLNDANSQTKLRQVLGKKSNINTDKLIEILNHPHYRPIIQAMFNKETGYLSAEAIKELLADNSKYSKDFIVNLLSNQVIDRQRLKQLIQSNKEGELETLKTVKSLGGENLQNQERLGNMLGKDSPLNPTLIPKIKKEMSEQSISNVFDKKSPANTTLIRRVINNKRINLSELNPISEMPEIIQEFAELLTCGNEDMQENILELLENNEVDGERLKELIKNSGNSQEEMAKLLDYIKESKENARARQETPEDEAWPEGQQSDEEQEEDGQQSSLPSLNFSINNGDPHAQTQKKKIAIADLKSSLSNFDEESMFDQRRRRNRTRFKKKEIAPVHLPSEEIYLQRIQAPHEALRGKKFRKSKKKTTKQPNKFMDEDNEVYDFDF